jgi:hypothetical protein
MTADDVFALANTPEGEMVDLDAGAISHETQSRRAEGGSVGD